MRGDDRYLSNGYFIKDQDKVIDDIVTPARYFQTRLQMCIVSRKNLLDGLRESVCGIRYFERMVDKIQRLQKQTLSKKDQFGLMSYCLPSAADHLLHINPDDSLSSGSWAKYGNESHKYLAWYFSGHETLG